MVMNHKKRLFLEGGTPTMNILNRSLLAEPQLNLSLDIVPDNQIKKGDDYINNASFNTEDMDVINATFDNGVTLPLFVGGTINMEIVIPESSYEDGSFVELYGLEIKPYVESILFHELTHVFEFYNRILNDKASPNFEQLSNLTQMLNKMGSVDDWDELMVFNLLTFIF